MTAYHYRAYTSAGQIAEGVLEAISESDALNQLHKRGFTPFETSPAEKPHARVAGLFARRTGFKASLSERAAFTRQLAVLLRADITLDRALRVLELQPPSERVKKLAATCSEGVAAGKSLSAILAVSGGGFAADEVGMIKAGEYTGSLAPILEELAHLLERRLDIRSRVVSALAYPAVLLVMAALSMIVIATVLVPNIAPLFEQSGAALPAIVRIVLGLNALVETYWSVLLVGMFILPFLAFAVLRQPQVRQAMDRIRLAMPFVGGLYRKNESARICRTLGTLLKSGLVLQSAIGAVRDVAANSITREELSKVIEAITGGRRLAAALEKSSILEPGIRQMIAIGEETNKLDAMLLHVASQQESEVARSIERLSAMLTPLMTVALGVLVGSLIMSVMQAILSINELAI